MLLDRALQRLRPLHHHRGQHREDDAQHDQRQREPPVDQERGRQQDENEDEGGEMFAEERDPHPPQRVAARQHDLQLPARMGAGMVGERQLQHVLEIICQHQIAPPVRQPVGEPRDQYAGDDDEQPEPHPGADQRRERQRGRADRGGQRAGQRVDDVAEQDRLDQLRHRERDVGERKYAGEAGFGREQRDEAGVGANKRHWQRTRYRGKSATVFRSEVRSTGGGEAPRVPGARDRRSCQDVPAPG